MHCQFKYPAQSKVPRKLGIRWTGDRDEISTGFEHSEGLLERLSVQTIQNYIAIAQDLFERLLLVIDRDICTETPDQVDIRRTRCRSHGCTNMLRELNGEGSHAARARVDQNFLPFLQFRLFDERLPSGQADQGDGSRFLHRQALGFNRQVIFAYRDELRECPDSVLVRSCVHLVAGLETPHARSHSDYDSCQLVTENERQSIRQEQFEFSVSDLGIQWVHTRSVDLNQDVILPHFRVWDFASPHAICASIAIDDERFHVALLVPGVRRSLTFPGPGCEAATPSVCRAADPFECPRPPIQPAQICEATADDSRARRPRNGVLGGRRWPLPARHRPRRSARRQLPSPP